MAPVVRDASAADAPACAAIYAGYVRATTITFEEEPPGRDEMARRISQALSTHAWLVAEDDGRVLGYAYGTRFGQRAAFRWSAETSVYLSPEARGAGIGRLLYTELLDRLAERGFRVAVAAITQPNAASMALHRAFGYEQVALLPTIGFKHGAWRDVAWLQRPLGPGPEPYATPAEPH